MKTKKRKKRVRVVPLAIPKRDEEAIAKKLEMLKAVDDRRYQIAKMFISGNLPSVIARKLGIEFRLVQQDLTIVRKEWIGIATQEILQLRADEYGRLLERQVEAEAAYQRSLEPRTVTKATRVGPGGQPVTTVMTFKRDGDPRLLAEIRKCIEARCRLLGLNLQPDEPMQQVHQHNTINLTNVSMDALKRIRGELLGLAGANAAAIEQRDLQTQPV